MNSDKQKVLKEELLKKVTGEFDLASIIKLNARELGIVDLGVIGECCGLLYLDLSSNKISEVGPLEYLKNLTTLNLSCNRITSLVGLQGLDSLKILNIAGNLITSADSLQPLVNLRSLENLRLQDKVRNISNPVCQTLPQYKTAICMLLASVSMLDGETISGEGSDVFQICDDLEVQLNEMEIDEKPVSYFKNESLDLDKKQNAMTSQKMEMKVAWSAEQQFEDLLVQCRSLNKEADNMICDVKQALWEMSKNAS